MVRYDEGTTRAPYRRVWVAHFAHAIRDGTHSGSGELWRQSESSAYPIILTEDAGQSSQRTQVARPHGPAVRHIRAATATRSGELYPSHLTFLPNSTCANPLGQCQRAARSAIDRAHANEFNSFRTVPSRRLTCQPNLPYLPAHLLVVASDNVWTSFRNPLPPALLSAPCSRVGRSTTTPRHEGKPWSGPQSCPGLSSLSGSSRVPGLWHHCPPSAGASGPMRRLRACRR
jgi:hypothetical protein